MLLFVQALYKRDELRERLLKGHAILVTVVIRLTVIERGAGAADSNAMGMTAVEKILARASGRDQVRPGEIVYPDPDLLFVHDGYIETLGAELEAVGATRVFDPSRFVVVTDHEVLYTSERAARRGLAIRAFVARYGITRFFDVGRGGLGHVFPAERGLVLPGMFIFAYDPHCTNFAAVGAVAMRNVTEVISVAATGTVWTMVPLSIRVELTGQLPRGVFVRDLAARIAADLAQRTRGVDPDYRAIEFAGPALESLNMYARMTLANAPTEIGVGTVFMAPSAAILEQVRSVAQAPFTVVESDDDAVYEAMLRYDLSLLEPQVAAPPGPENLVGISSVVGKRIDHAVIGSCASGMYEDMAVAARLLRDNRIADHVRLLITPASEDIYNRCAREGFLDVFQRAGAIVTPPGCGPCAGGKIGALGPGEVSLSTITTNHPGRMGAIDAEIFLASPATVAASAVAGAIVDVRAWPTQW